VITIKLIFHYQVRKEMNIFFSFKNGREHMRNESKNNKYFSLYKQKKTSEREKITISEKLKKK